MLLFSRDRRAAGGEPPVRPRGGADHAARRAAAAGWPPTAAPSRCRRPARASWPSSRSRPTRWRATWTASDRARRELVAAVSHDLRTPIASLGLLVDAVADGVVTSPEEIADYQARMRVHLAHLRELVDDLFELARLDAGDVAWERVPVRRGRAGRGDGRGVPARRPRSGSVTLDRARLRRRAGRDGEPRAAAARAVQPARERRRARAGRRCRDADGGARERRRPVRGRRHGQRDHARGRGRACSTASTAAATAPRGPPAAPDWGSRSRARSSRRTAAGSGSRTRASVARGWPSRSPAFSGRLTRPFEFKPRPCAA